MANSINGQFSFLSNQFKRSVVYFKDGSEKNGFVKFTNNDRIKFKTDKKEKTVNLSHETVDKIITRIDGIKSTFQYRTIKGRKKPSLLEILGSGKVTLYRDSFTTNTNNKNFSNSFNTNKYTYYYVSKSDEKEITDLDYKKFSPKHFIKAAKLYFKDCPQLIDKLEKKELGRRDFVAIVDYYNEDCDFKK